MSLSNHSILRHVQDSLWSADHPLLELWKASDARLIGADLSNVRVRLASVGTWWLASIRGSGMVRLQSGSEQDPPAGRALVSLTSAGQYRSPGSPEFLGRANRISLSRWSNLSPLTAWGSFEFLVAYVPEVELRECFATAPFGRSLSSDRGAAAVLADCLRGLARQCFAGGRASLPLALAGMRMMMVDVFGQDAGDNESLTPPGAALTDFIASHFTDPDLTAAVVSRACNMSTRQFYRTFAQRGEQFHDLLRRRRISHALTLLRNDQARPITDVALECGFKTSSHFSQVFRQMQGVSPSRWRRQQSVR